MALRLLKQDVCPIPSGAEHISLTNIFKSYDKKTYAVSDLTLEIKKGEFFSLLGPSGCGKTTILRLIAGLEAPDRGTIKIGEDIVAGESWIPPEKRGVGFVFQDYALFPHMTVFKNVAFGIKGCPKQEISQRVMEMLELVGLAKEGKKYPHELSGGQQQRVALARALAPFPKFMLLDEPFSNLDADLRVELRQDTKRILKGKGITTILVTHDQEEAFSLSDRVGVLNQGRLEQVGTPEDIYHKPKTRFVANFVGRADFVSGRIQGNMVISDIGKFRCSNNILCKEDEVDLMIRPDDVDFIISEDGEATIIDVQFLGAEVLYKIRLGSGMSIHSIKPSTNMFAVGSNVKISVDPNHIIVFPKWGE